jgi:hypothetical protein
MTYTSEDILSALTAKTQPRIISFRYDLLDKADGFIKALDCVESCSISYNVFADIKRTATFSILDGGDIDFLNDRIQPFVRLKMPDGSYQEWSMGIFLLSSPERQERNGKIYRNVAAYDGLQVLLDDKFDDRYYIAAGTSYVSAIITILTGAGIKKTNIQTSSKTLTSAKEFDPGVSKLSAINDLLSSLNYISLYVDENGFYTSNEYVSPSNRAIDMTYADDELSVIYNGLTDSLDLFSVPNKWVVYTSNAEETSLRAVYTNTSADSPLSTVSRGRTIVDYREVSDIADQTTLNNYVARLAAEASQVYGYITCETAIMPMHGHNNIVKIQYSSLEIDEIFTETDWSFNLEAGAKMAHKLRRVVLV